MKCSYCKREGHRKRNCPYDPNMKVEARIPGNYKCVSPEVMRIARKLNKQTS